MTKKIVKLAMLAVVFAASLLVAGTANAQSKRWIGIIAVQESPLVNQVIRESGNNPAVYGMKLRRMLDTGEVQPAKGRYAFIPYMNGRAYERAESFYTHSGVYTMWAPAEFVSPGRSMCVRVPNSWPAIVGQIRYPERGGRRVNCYDFGQEAKGNFASTRHTAAMVVVVAPAG